MPAARTGPPGVSADNIIEGSRKRARQDNEASPTLGANPGLGLRASSTGASGASGGEMNEREEATYKGFKLLDAIVHKRDTSDGQLLAVPFLALLSRKAYPDYYDIVKTPLSFEGVRRRLIERDFENFDQVRHTLEGVCRNAKRYNQNGSEIFEKARQLHSYIRDAYADLVEKGEVDKQPGDVVASTPGLQQQSEKLAKIETPSSRARLDYDEDEDGSVAIDIRLKRDDDVPYMEDGDDPEDGQDDDDGAADEDAEDEVTEQAVKDVASSDLLNGSNNSNGSAAPTEPIKRGRGRPRGSRGRGRGRGRGAGLSATRITLRRSSGRADDAIGTDGSPGRLKAELRKELETIKALRDEDGDDLCEVFLELPSRRSYPDYYKVIAEPISLEEIETSIESTAYGVSDFVSDLLRMVHNAQFYNEDGSLIWAAAQQIKEHVEKETAPNLKSWEHATARDTAQLSDIKDEEGRAGQSGDGSRLKVRLTSRAPSASASPALENKESVEGRRQVASPSASMGPPLQMMSRQNSSGALQTSIATSSTPPTMAVSPTVTSVSQVSPSGQLPAAQQLRPPGPGAPNARPSSVSPMPGQAPAQHPQAPAASRPSHLSQSPGAQYAPHVTQHQPRPGYPSRPPAHQMSPSPGPNGLPAFHQARHSPQFGPRPGMPGAQRPFGAGSPVQVQSPQPSNLSRSSRRLEGEGPFDPLSVLRLETEDGKLLSRTPVTGAFSIKVVGSNGQVRETLLSNKVARIHSLLVNASKEPNDLTEISFRVRGVVQRHGARETPFTAAPHWKVQIIYNGQGIARIGHRLDNAPAVMAEKMAKTVNGVTADNHNDGDQSDSENGSPDATDVGDSKDKSPSHNAGAGMTYTSGQNGIFDVPPFSMCSVRVRPTPGVNVVDIAIAPPPPDARLAALAMAPPDAPVPPHLRIHAQALLNVPERYRIYLQCR